MAKRQTRIARAPTTIEAELGGDLDEDALELEERDDWREGTCRFCPGELKRVRSVRDLEGEWWPQCEDCQPRAPRPEPKRIGVIERRRKGMLSAGDGPGEHSFDPDSLCDEDYRDVELEANEICRARTELAMWRESVYADARRHPHAWIHRRGVQELARIETQVAAAEYLHHTGRTSAVIAAILGVTRQRASKLIAEAASAREKREREFAELRRKAQRAEKELADLEIEARRLRAARAVNGSVD